MSMISAQIDELRKAAEYYDGSEVASIMRYAADTIWQLRDDLQRANAENAKLRDEFDKMYKWHSAELIAEMDENANLREQMEWLVTLLRVDCDIDASWDGLRRFWSIGLTENGCLMRDRACKAEAENAKLRELVRDMWNDAIEFDGFLDYVMDDGEIYDECVLPHYQERMRELGIEVN